jgi:cell volume regulation protein A
VLWPAISLALVGTLITAALSGLAAMWLFELTLLEGLLVGAILSSTDGAAIFALLRGSTLRRRLARTLEGESGFNDPIAVLLVLGFIEWIELPDYGVGDMAVLFVMEIAIGIVVGVGIGWLAVQGFLRATLVTSGLYPVASLATAGPRVRPGRHAARVGLPRRLPRRPGARLGADPAKRTVTSFHDGLGWVAQLAMFLTLGLLVFPSQLVDIAFEGAVLAIVVVVVARRSPRGCDAAVRVPPGRAAPARVGRPEGRGPGRARDVPAHRRRAAEPRVLQHRLLRRACCRRCCRARRSRGSPHG